MSKEIQLKADIFDILLVQEQHQQELKRLEELKIAKLKELQQLQTEEKATDTSN